MLAKWSGRRKAKTYIENQVKDWPPRLTGLAGPLMDMVQCRKVTSDHEAVISFIEDNYTDETTRGLIPCKVKAHRDIQDLGINAVCYVVDGRAMFRALVYLVNSEPGEVIVTHESKHHSESSKQKHIVEFMKELTNLVTWLPHSVHFKDITINVPAWPETTTPPTGNRALRLHRSVYVLE